MGQDTAAGDVATYSTKGVDPPIGTFEDLDAYYAQGKPEEKTQTTVDKVLWQGGRTFDAFLVAASAQVGQVILNLPNTMALTGMASSIIWQITFAAVAVYTLYLLSSLYAEFKRALIKRGEWYTSADGTERTVVNQYHNVIYEVTGSRWLAEFSRVVNVAELLGLCVAQILASSSNFYLLNENINKRGYAFIFGGVGILISFIPSFRNMRLFAVLALVGTSYTSAFMILSSWINGLDSSAPGRAPTSLLNYFAGFSNIIFTFGGHCMLLEVVDAQWKPSKFHKTFSFALIYVTAFLTLPNALFTYWAFPDSALAHGNAFAIFPNTPQRNVGIVLLVAHQIIAYALFIMPVLYMWEKLVKTHDKPLWIRLPSRLPVPLFVYFIAILLPFFRTINDLMGAFCVSFETYIIPPLAFNIYFWSAARRENALLKPPRWLPGGWNTIFVFNTIIGVSVLVLGAGFGGWASVKEVVGAVDSFGVFTPCYGC